jgi:hypothetical protein
MRGAVLFGWMDHLLPLIRLLVTPAPWLPVAHHVSLLTGRQGGLAITTLRPTRVVRVYRK